MKIGDKVYNHKKYAFVGKHAPLKGTEFECQGTIVELIPDNLPFFKDMVKIEWDNGYTNELPKQFLEKVNITNFFNKDLFTL